MLKKLMNMKKKKGFTLIELIVVLVIMAILAAAAIPTMMGYVDKARASQYLAEGRAVYVAATAGATEGYGHETTHAAVKVVGVKIGDAVTAGTDMAYYVKAAVHDVCRDSTMQDSTYAVSIDDSGRVLKVEYITGKYLVTIDPAGEGTVTKSDSPAFTITT